MNKNLNYRDPDILRYLYWNKKLTLRQLAEKLSVSVPTISHWMIKNKIRRRTNSEAQEKYNIPKEVLENLYLKKKLNTVQIAKIFNTSSSTISYKMRKYKIPIRNKSERTIKYPKKSFSGNLNEKAYMLGLRAGDLSAMEKPGNSQLIRVQSASSHPAFIRMMETVFGEYSAIRTHLRINKSWKEWVVYSDLDMSFKFLVKKPKEIPKWILGNNKYFLSFLVGYMDAEGNLLITKSNNNDVRYMFRIRTCDKRILEQIKHKLEDLDFKCHFYLAKKRGSLTTFGKINNDFFGIRIYRTKNIIRLINLLLPSSRHDEKIRKMKFILENKNYKWNSIKDSVQELRNSIKSEVIK